MDNIPLNSISLSYESLESSMSVGSGYTKSASSQWYNEYQVPFCEPFNCYVSTGEEVEGAHEINPILWRCLPPECKTKLTALVGGIITLAVMTITFNCLILAVNLTSKTRRMRRRNPTMNNYSTYIVSLAVADLLVGVVVLPLCLVNYYMEFMSNKVSVVKRTEGISNDTETIITTSGSANLVLPRLLEVANDNATWPTTEYSLVRASNLSTPTTSADVVRDLLGFFTHLTLFVSLYTLITASADRFYAATHTTCMKMKSSGTSKRSTGKSGGMFCRKLSSSKRSSFAVCVVWLLGIAFALTPLAMRPTFYFREIGHVFVGMSSEESYSTGVIWYLWTLVVPLIVMWIFNILICFTLWRRKNQLGLSRKRSLRNKHSMPTTKTQKNISSRNTSASDDVFESEGKKATGSLKQFEAQGVSKRGSSSARTSSNYSSGHRLLQATGSSSSAFQSSVSSLREVKKSGNGSNKGIRRTMSSLRRAREMLRNQSYEANITKTLCIVVAAFTVAVLPLVIILSMLSLEEDAPIRRLNKEVTALTCSLLILFSNSFINCVIYGARMRDFRREFTHLFQSYIRGIKNKHCHCLLTNDQNNFIADASSNTFQFLRPGNTKSPNLARSKQGHRFFSVSKTMTDENRTDSMKEVNNIKPIVRTVDSIRLSEATSPGQKEKCLLQVSPTNFTEKNALTSEGFHSARGWFSDQIESSTPTNQEQQALMYVVTRAGPNAIYTRRQQKEHNSSCSSYQTSWRNSFNTEPFQDSGSSSLNVQNNNTLVSINKNKTTEAAMNNIPVANCSETFRSDDTSLVELPDYPTLKDEIHNHLSKELPTFDSDLVSADFESSKFFDAACDYGNGNDGVSLDIQSWGNGLGELQR